MRRFTPIEVTADFVRHTEITLQGVPNAKYQLGLSVGDQEIELQRNGNRTWTPVQRPYVLCLLIIYAYRRFCACRDIFPTSEMRVDVQRIIGHLFFAKSRQTNEVIDLQELFNEYWSADKSQFTVPSQS